MDLVEQTVTLSARPGSGPLVPPAGVGDVLRGIPTAVQGAIRMAIEGRSATRGARPGWLARAADIRLRAVETGDEQARAIFLAPRLGDAAGELLAQLDLWKSKPDPALTGFDLFRRVVRDVASENRDSDAFDRGLLLSVRHFRHAFESLDSVSIDNAEPGVLDRKAIDSAKRLSDQTPPSRLVHVVGKLDMLRHSSSAFGVALDTGEEIRGVLVEGDVEAFKDFFGRRVLLTGNAVFRPSGNLLRLEATEIASGDDAPDLWSRAPRALERTREAPRRLTAPPGARAGVAAFFGTWPGEESEQDLLDALDELG